MMIGNFQGRIVRKPLNLVHFYIGQPTTTALYSLPRDSNIPRVVHLTIRPLRLGCTFHFDRLIHTYR